MTKDGDVDDKDSDAEDIMMHDIQYQAINYRWMIIIMMIQVLCRSAADCILFNPAHSIWDDEEDDDDAS